jgi:hypothetical protein
MILRSPALADDSKGVVLHDRGAADSAEKTLLHPAVETKNSDFGGRLNLYVSEFRVKTKG